MCRNTACLTGLVVASLFFALLGLIAIFVVPKEVAAQLKLQLPLSSPKSVIFKAWQDTEADNIVVERNFYFFNLTNPYEVYNNHSTPDFVPVGPFVFKEHTYSPLDSINWKADATVAFQYSSDFTFIPEKSIDRRTGAQLSLDTRIIYPNLPLWSGTWRLNRFVHAYDDGHAIGLANLLCHQVTANVSDTIVGDSGIFANRTLGEVFFGYEDPIWTTLAKGAGLLGYEIPTIFRAVFNGSQPAPSPITDLHGQRCPMWDDQSICNSSSLPNRILTGDEWTIASQVDVNGGLQAGANVDYGSFEHLADFVQWAGQDRMWWWGNDNNGSCQKFEGSNGMIYPSGLTKESRPWVFYDAIFRKIRFQFRKTGETLGVPTYTFGLDDEDQAAGPQTKCYGQEYDALMNLTAAMYGPAYISNPYFFKLDTQQQDKEVNGTHPLVNVKIEGIPISAWKAMNDEDDFTTRLDIEPTTGTLLEAHARIQFTTFMGEIKNDLCPELLPQLKPRDVYQNGVLVQNSEFPRTLFPFFYLDRHALMPQSLANRVYFDVVLPLVLAKYLGGIIAALALFTLFFCLVKLFLNRRSEPGDNYYINSEERYPLNNKA